MAREKILIIENANAAQAKILAALSDVRYEAESVKGAHEGFERMSRKTYDLILADISLPEMNGLKLLQRVNDLQENVPTVVMADSGDLQKATLALKFGANGFIVKPFTPRELSIAVEAALRKKRMARRREDFRLFEALDGAHFEAMKVLAQAIEAKDHYTGGHCDRMVQYAVAIAGALGLSEVEKKILRYGAALHDIGKIGIPEAILNKPGKLTDEEYAVMKTHPEKGAAIIRGVSFLAPVVPVIYHHQERYDGRGYPGGLAGEEIPLGSRIVSVLDTFDAMTSDRPYREALPLKRAVAELRRYSNQQFDPYVVEAFLRLDPEGSWELEHFPYSEVPANHFHPPVQL